LTFFIFFPPSSPAPSPSLSFCFSFFSQLTSWRHSTGSLIPFFRGSPRSLELALRFSEPFSPIMTSSIYPQFCQYTLPRTYVFLPSGPVPDFGVPQFNIRQLSSPAASPLGRIVLCPCFLFSPLWRRPPVQLNFFPPRSPFPFVL